MTLLDDEYEFIRGVMPTLFSYTSILYVISETMSNKEAIHAILAGIGGFLAGISVMCYYIYKIIILRRALEHKHEHHHKKES